MASVLHEIPLFPLGTVLFPDGRLPLRIFEPRYMDMAKVCLKNDLPFGVCLIASGRETGAPALPHTIGTLAHIAEWDMPQLGVLQVMCRGEQRFRIVSRRIETSGLQRAEVELLPAATASTFEPRHEVLADLLARVIDNLDDTESLEPFRYDDPVWVGHRLGEMLPLSMADKQRMLESDDAASRLDIVQQYLQTQGLLNPSK